jgi:hypothetical protein
MSDLGEMLGRKMDEILRDTLLAQNNESIDALKEQISDLTVSRGELRNHIDTLIEVSKDLLKRIETLEGTDKRRLDQMCGWIDRIERLEEVIPRYDGLHKEQYDTIESMKEAHENLCGMVDEIRGIKYQPQEHPSTYTFKKAINLMLEGKQIRRRGWNDDGRWWSVKSLMKNTHYYILSAEDITAVDWEVKE